jgi:hypothetical protein
MINSLTTRKCSDEYFFSQIPYNTTQIEIHHPPTIDPRETLKLYLGQSYTNKILGYSLILPTNFYIAKFYFLAANFLFTYHAFRVNLAIRSYYGQKRLVHLFNTSKVAFVPSETLEKIKDKCTVEGDLDDDHIYELGKELNLVGIERSYRRHRMQVLVGKYQYK